MTFMILQMCNKSTVRYTKGLLTTVDTTVDATVCMYYQICNDNSAKSRSLFGDECVCHNAYLGVQQNY